MLFLLPGLAALVTEADAAYHREIEAFRRGREERNAGEDGWLATAGLFWLREGKNRFGTAADSEIVLPSGPARAGVLHVEQGRASVEVAAGVAVTLDGQKITQRPLRSDANGAPDVLSLGRLRLFVIERGGRLAVRLRDPDTPARRAFRGLRWFPIRPEYRVIGRFVAHPAPRRLRVPNVLGMVEPMESPGVVVFRLDGKELRLEPVFETADKKELFFLFRDRTAGRETYGAGRFLYADLPAGGRVALDFNKAFTPPCAFTRFATCPLPPRQNILPVRIEAGELDDGVPGH